MAARAQPICTAAWPVTVLPVGGADPADLSAGAVGACCVDASKPDALADDDSLSARRGRVTAAVQAEPLQALIMCF